MARRRTVTRWLYAHRDRAIDLLRIYLGAGLFLQGVRFASDPQLVPSLLHDGGHFTASAALIAHYVVGAHLAGGALLTVGLFTRLAAVIQIPVLFGAVVFVHSGEGLFARSNSLEFALLVLFLLVLMLFHGGGLWSLDQLVRSLRTQTDFDVDADAHPREV